MNRGLLIFTLASTLVAQSPIRIDEREASLHGTGSGSIIRVPKPEGPSSFPVEVRVNKLGQIADVKPVPGGRAEYFEAAEKMVRLSHYEPFVRDGQPVEAIVWAWIFVLPEEIQPKVQVAFPEVQDWKSVRFKLSRTVCFGSCPSYEVEIQGDGLVTYTGRSDVAVRGTHKGSITREKLQALMDRFRGADFFSFDPRYSANLTDGPTYTTSVTIDGREHFVADYYGIEAGMPMVIRELENAIDEGSGSAKWTRGNVETVSALRAEGFDFASQEAGRVLAAVARRGSVDSVRALLLAGTPLDVPDVGMFGGLTPLQGAAHNPDPEVKLLLVEAGASK